MTHRFLYWPEEEDEEQDIPSTFEKIIKQPKMKGEYVRERDNIRREKATPQDS